MNERVPLPVPLRGMNTLTDPIGGDLSFSPEIRNARVHRGVLQQRPGFRGLAFEPSWRDVNLVEKNRMSLNFAEASSEYGHTAFTSELGTQWTIRMETIWAVAGNEPATGHGLFEIFDGSGNPIVRFQAIGDGAGQGLQLRAQVWDRDGGTAFVATQIKSITSWAATRDGRFIVIRRDADTLSLEVGGTVEGTGTGTLGSNVPSAVGATIYIGRTQLAYGNQDLIGLTIFNRLLEEEDLYLGIQYPMDAMTADYSIFGHWPVVAGSGATLKDYSVYGRDITLVNTPTWTTGSHRFARGLGMHSFRRNDGKIYTMLAAGRNGTSNAGAAPSGAVYGWEQVAPWESFAYGGDPDNYDGTAGLDGLDLLAAIEFETIGNICAIVNGVDFSRKFNGTSYRYFGGSAPPVGPILTALTPGGAMADGVYQYAFSYLNSTDKTETGRSPIVSVTISGGGGAGRVQIGWWITADPQFDYVRIWRSQAGQDDMYLVKTVAIAASQPVVDSLADAVIVNFERMPRDQTKRLYLQGGPPTAPTVAAGASTGLTGEYYCAYAYRNTATGEETGMSPAARVNVTNQDISWTNLIPSADTSYDVVVQYRTKAGGRLWYEVQEIPGQSTAATENVADNALTITVETKALPPKCRYITQFASRVWMADDDTVYWSAYGSGEDFNFVSAHRPYLGSSVRGISASGNVLLIHYLDGTIMAIPHPGDLLDLELFVAVQTYQVSAVGAAVAHRVVKQTDIGLVWLSNIGIMRCVGDEVSVLSTAIAPEFKTLNLERAQFACAMYDDQNHLYMVWLSRWSRRLNDECLVMDTRTMAFVWDDIQADCAGILLDAEYRKRYCFMTMFGVVNEFHDRDHHMDGASHGTTHWQIQNAGIHNFDPDGVYGYPPNCGGGFPLYLRKSDGTTAQRWVIPTVLAINDQKVSFYPSLAAIKTGTWNAYMSGIRGLFQTMWTALVDRRLPKTLLNLFVSTAKGTGGTASVGVGVDQESIVDTGNDVSLGSVESLVECRDGLVSAGAQAEGRVFQVQVWHDPPVAGESMVVQTMEAEVEYSPTESDG